MIDSIFHGAPNSVVQSSGQASLAIDVTSGTLYFRSPNSDGWAAISGSGGGPFLELNPTSIPPFQTITGGSSIIMQDDLGVNTILINSQAGYVALNNTGRFAFGPDTDVLGAALDTGFSRLAPGEIAIGNGGAGDFSGSLKLTTLFMGQEGIPIQETQLGFSNIYRILRIGLNTPLRSLALNIDPSIIPGGNFSGVGQIFIDNQSIMAPNSGGTDWIGVLRATGSSIYLGGSTSSGELSGTALAVTGNNVTVGGVVSAASFQIDGTAQAGNVLIGNGTNFISAPLAYTNFSSFGAKGDGTTDDRASIQAAIDATPVGGALFIPAPAVYYKVVGTLNITKAITIQGFNSQINQATANTVLINVTSNNVWLTGLNLQGVSGASNNINEIAIHISGVFNSGSSPTNISNINVDNCIIQNWGGYGILASYVMNVQFLLNRFYNINYTAIGLLSIITGTVSKNQIDTVNGVGQANCYGIYVSRNTGDTGELVSQPFSSDLTVDGNTIRNIPKWEALDSHGSQRVTFSNNIIFNTFYGIAVGSSANSLGADTYGPIDTVVSGNIMDSSVTDGSRVTGIYLQGITGVPAQRGTGAITGNTVRGYGTSTVSSGQTGGILIFATKAVPVSGNTIIEPSPNGIAIFNDNIGFLAEGNSIVDPWTDAVGVGQAIAINLQASNNTGIVGGNSAIHDIKVATYLLTTSNGTFLYINNNPSNSVSLGLNKSQATIYLLDAGLTTAISQMRQLPFTVAPTIASGFGTSPSITTSNGTEAFTINVGSGGSATSGVITLPVSNSGWVCTVTDITTQSATVFITKQIGSSTTSVTIANFNTSGAQAPWAANDILSVSCAPI